MKVRNKGKVYPSLSSSSHSPYDDVFSSVLKLLPAAILALASVLSLEDREVLAYMITRSMKSTNPSSLIDGKKKNNSMKSTTTTQHKAPVFDCECFDCYTSYWFKWDSSPNRELIHQAIEAFEEHLNNGEQSKKKNRGKKREKMGRRHFPDKPVLSPEVFPTEGESDDVTEIEDSFVQVFPETGVEEVVMAEEGLQEEVTTLVVSRATAASDHKGLARKVLPDVLGLFNSRLWNLWSPNV